MNYYNFLQTGGFPMDVNVLDNMQRAYQLFNGLGALAGDLSIIKGCDISGNTVSDGIVYINGEVLEFRSGLLSNNVVIVEEPSSSTFENGQVKTTHFVRYATFGVATTSYPWASFKRAFPTKEIASSLAQKEDKLVVAALLERITTLEEKMQTIARGAEVNVSPDWNATEGDGVILNKPEIVSPYLYKGAYSVGDVAAPGADTTLTIPIQDVGTSNYVVVGSLVSKGNVLVDNDVWWITKNTTPISFQLSLREAANGTQSLEFRYVLIAL